MLGPSSQRLLRGPLHRIEGSDLPGPELERLRSLVEEHLESGSSEAVQKLRRSEEGGDPRIVHEIVDEPRLYNHALRHRQANADAVRAGRGRADEARHRTPPGQ